jgi:O-acetylserine/cysteine efflux transporter
MQKDISMVMQDKFAALAVILIWGINFYVMKVGVSEVSPMFLGILRYAMVLLPAVFLVKLPQVGWKWLLLYGLLSNFAQFALMFSAINSGMPTGLVALVVQSQAFFSVLIARLMFNERVAWNQWLAIAMAGLGLVCIAWGQQQGQVPLVGLLLVLAAAVSWACGNIVVKCIGPVQPIALVVWGNILTPLWFLLLALGDGGWTGLMADWQALSWKALLAAAFLAYFATLIGYGLWVHLLAKYSVAKISPLSLWVPVVSMLFASGYLDEQLQPWQWFGAAVIMLSLMVQLFAQPLINYVLHKFCWAKSVS